MEQEKIIWSPEDKIEISGREFETFTRLAALYEIPFIQLSPKEVQELFLPVLQTNQEVLKRMLDSGVAKRVSNTGEDLPILPEDVTPLPID